MIAAAALVPGPPLLLPGVTGGAVDTVEVLRASCLEAVVGLLGARPDRLVLVGAARDGEPVGSLDTPLPSPLGRIAPTPADRPAPGALPVSLAVGAALVGAAQVDAPAAVDGVEITVELRSLDPHTSSGDCFSLGAELRNAPDAVALLVVADGSARRRESSPGYLDPRAMEFDARVQAALVEFDAPTLLGVETELAKELWATGRVGWQVLAGALADSHPATTVRYADDPFGVWYSVIGWSIES